VCSPDKLIGIVILQSIMINDVLPDTVSDANYIAVTGEELLFPTGVEGETLCHNISIIKSDDCSAAAGSELNFTSRLTSTAFNLILDPLQVAVVIDDYNETECGEYGEREKGETCTELMAVSYISQCRCYIGRLQHNRCHCW